MNHTVFYEFLVYICQYAPNNCQHLNFCSGVMCLFLRFNFNCIPHILKKYYDLDFVLTITHLIPSSWFVYVSVSFNFDSITRYIVSLVYVIVVTDKGGGVYVVRFVIYVSCSTYVIQHFTLDCIKSLNPDPESLILYICLCRT